MCSGAATGAGRPTRQFVNPWVQVFRFHFIPVVSSALGASQARTPASITPTGHALRTLDRHMDDMASI